MWIGGRGRHRRRHRILYTASDQRSDCGHFGNIGTGDLDMKRYSKNSSNDLKYWILIASCALFALMTPTASSKEMLPAWRPHSSSGIGRNIRHLPCVSRRTGETGLCMFAYSCAKANGTHLGTCIDRFYFGSCCKITSNSDPDLVDPIVHNYLNKDDSSSMKTPYQRPSSSVPQKPISGLPNMSFDTFSTMSLPASVSTMSRPLSITSIPSSSTTDFFTTMFIKPGSTNLSSLYTISSAAYDTMPVTSRTPVMNVTFSQSYSTPSTFVTSSPVIYSTTVSTIFQTGTHKPVSAFQTTAYSKPISKPTSKPGTKPKPTSGKPTAVKPKPTKPANKPTLSFSSTSPSVSTFANKTTVHTSFTGAGLSSKPSYVTDSTIPTKTTSARPPTQGIPTPISIFTSSRRPTGPTKPSIYTTTTSPTTYIKIPVTTQSPSRPSTTISSSTFMSSSTYGTNTISFEQNLKINSTVEVENESENEVTEKPFRPWTSSLSSSTTYSTRPWTMSSSGSTQTQLVTWTTINEIPALIIPDRTKPTTLSKPTGKPPVTKPLIMPTYTKPFISSMGGSTSKLPATKPTSTDSDTTETYKPVMTISSSATPVISSSSSWVEVNVTQHAPTISPSSNATHSSEDITVAMTSQTSSKPSTSYTIPVVSPLPIETTQVPPPVETNEIESPGFNMSNYKEVCGRRLFPTARIVGGEKATFGKWPWQISLRQWRTSTYLHKCGAALFNENWAVTAAHCVENVPPGDLLLRLGEHDLSVEDEPYGYQERRVQIVASHPQFDPRTFEYDLALLRFYEPVKFQPNIIPICVPEDDTNFVGSTAYVTGWGRLYDDGPLPSVLQEVSVPVINNSVCESMYQAAGYTEHIPNIFICAGWKKGGFDSCEGDSGGPMVIQRPDKRWLLAGIISWGIGCAEPNQPGVYTRISEFRDWINQILQF